MAPWRAYLPISCSVKLASRRGQDLCIALQSTTPLCLLICHLESCLCNIMYIALLTCKTTELLGSLYCESFWAGLFVIKRRMLVPELRWCSRLTRFTTGHDFKPRDRPGQALSASGEQLAWDNGRRAPMNCCQPNQCPTGNFAASSRGR